jgi:thymidine kinase
MKLLRIWTGPMSGGKTTEALQVARRYARQNLRVVLVRPISSRRSHETRANTLSTKAGEEFPSIDLTSADEIPGACAQADVVWIDEPAIFINEEKLADIVAKLRKVSIILVSGLGATSELEPFGASMPKLLAVADEVNWSNADCDACGEHGTATRSLYIGAAPKTEQVRVGGEESFTPTCVACWTQLMMLEPSVRRTYLSSFRSSTNLSKSAS